MIRNFTAQVSSQKTEKEKWRMTKRLIDIDEIDEIDEKLGVCRNYSLQVSLPSLEPARDPIERPKG